MRGWGWLLVGALLLFVIVAARAAGQGFGQIGFTTFTTDVTLTTTSETSVVASTPVTAPRGIVDICVLAWAQLTTGTMTTAVTPRIRRDTTTSGTLVGEANAETLKAAAAGTEPFFAFACESRNDVSSVQYNFTLQQTAANANGSALQGGILVLVR